MATTSPAQFRSPSGRYIHWEQVITRARKQPGTWFLAFPAAHVSVANTVRRQRAPALRNLDPPLLVEVRNEYTDAAGTRRGDLFITIEEN